MNALIYLSREDTQRYGKYNLKNLFLLKLYYSIE